MNETGLSEKELCEKYLCPTCGKDTEEAHTKSCMIRLIGKANCYYVNLRGNEWQREQRAKAEDRALRLKHENNKLRRKLYPNK